MIYNNSKQIIPNGCLFLVMGEFEPSNPLFPVNTQPCKGFLPRAVAPSVLLAKLRRSKFFIFLQIIAMYTVQCTVYIVQLLNKVKPSD